MPTKKEMAQELKRLREQLRKNEELLRLAAIKAEELQGIQIGLGQTQQAVRKTRAAAQGSPSPVRTFSLPPIQRPKNGLKR